MRGAFSLKVGAKYLLAKYSGHLFLTWLLVTIFPCSIGKSILESVPLFLFLTPTAYYMWIQMSPETQTLGTCLVPSRCSYFGRVLALWEVGTGWRISSGVWLWWAWMASVPFSISAFCSAWSLPSIGNSSYHDVLGPCGWDQVTRLNLLKLWAKIVIIRNR